ncbi:hypothetical protein N802_12720 [Knoellia sinensis KCTC 19936]|uniref:Cholesterol esterase n=1 Tax=Knoellia sinensis KCTC 19936 TaxID=1385520 RepID=A0A0A0JFN7_9MICO|nr:DUF6230 family protein [Knoellia sinensis]KGN34411.1 hypothetical protein N802_12720 [Knoellia sinensis KCTC 19936]
MGRTRAGKFAAVSVPALAVSLGFGVAIAQGLVSATLSSANGFELAGSKTTATSMKLGLGTAQVAGAAGATDKQAAVADMAGTKLTGMCMAANDTIPVFGNIGVKIATAPADITDVGAVTLNAASITAGTTDLPKTTVGQAASEAGVSSSSANPNGFALTSVSQSGTDLVDLTGMNATAYALTLESGLTLSSLNVTPTTSTATCG